MSFVLDASITLSWCFEDEASDKTFAILEKLMVEQAYVPEIWTLEIGNILVNASRKKRISYAKVIEFLDTLENLDIEIDHQTATKGFHDILQLAHSTKLTTYDAAYLELAMRLGVPIATKDTLLINTAKELGVEVL